MSQETKADPKQRNISLTEEAAAMNRTYGHIRQPLLELSQPILQRAARYNDEVRAAAPVVK